MKVYMTGIFTVKSPEKTCRTHGQTYTKEALIDFIAGNTLLATGGGADRQKFTMILSLFWPEIS